eukprot:CAMPEP_0198147540 /NCGR_PEP_ID=MMETSP1443-20131203/36443_1 /TAXON_ID=186043 /ORGANISM="Entomoneis sp., Strain CCMP2396" /LENGTH=198 /DNA_ID=CAMNT_0043811925 /DNA_START=85 /DNA_END=681 /DNA_ORIENTATION=-
MRNTTESFTLDTSDTENSSTRSGAKTEDITLLEPLPKGLRIMAFVIVVLFATAIILGLTSLFLDQKSESIEPNQDTSIGAPSFAGWSHRKQDSSQATSDLFTEKNGPKRVRARRLGKNATQQNQANIQRLQESNLQKPTKGWVFNVDESASQNLLAIKLIAGSNAEGHRATRKRQVGGSVVQHEHQMPTKAWNFGPEV